MSTQNNLTDFLTNIANSIRAAKGTSGLINPQDFADNISDLSLGYNVTFNDGTSDYTIVSVPPGGSITEPPVPSNPPYQFKGWYTAETGGEQISFPYTPSGHITVYAQWIQQTVIGATGFYNNQAGTLTWTDDIADFTSYTTSQSGNFVSVSSPLDNVFPYNKISEMTDAEGNVFVKIPKLWMKWVRNSSSVTGVKISNIQMDSDYFIPDCFLDPSDSTLNTYLDYVAIGKYEGSGSTSKLYSKSGETLLTSISRSNARAAARAYGTSSNEYNGYQLYDISMWTLYNVLCSIYYKTTVITSVFAGNTNTNTVQNSGNTDGIAGLNGWNTQNKCVKMLGVENPYGNIFKYVDGIFMSAVSPAGVYVWRKPSAYADSNYGAISAGALYTRSGTRWWTSARKLEDPETQSLLLPANNYSDANEGWIGSYYAVSDYQYVLKTSGSCNEATKYAGIWAFRGNQTTLSPSQYDGARLAYRPVGVA